MLKRAPDSVRRYCARAARTVGYAIACPRFLPDWPSSYFRSLPGNRAAPNYVVAGSEGQRGWTDLSVAVPTWVPRHLVIQSAPREVRPFDFVCLCHSRYEARFPNAPPWAKLVPAGHLQLDGHYAFLVKVIAAEGISYNHTILIWNEGGHTYGVGFHRPSGGTRLADIAVAKHLVFIRPSP